MRLKTSKRSFAKLANDPFFISKYYFLEGKEPLI